MPESCSLSIAICTYNRAQQLEPLLRQCLALADTFQSTTELLLIDNNSNDETLDLAATFEMPFEFRILSELKQGLAHARNCALDNFKGDAILFLDDDVSISSECIQAYQTALAQWPEAGYFGGPIEVNWQGVAPTWLQSNDLPLLSGLFGEYRPANENTEYDGSIFDPYGANFMLRRTTVDQVGLFNGELGVKGQAIGRGEETEYFRRARQVGVHGQYVVAAAVGHRFQRERINIPYLYRYGLEKGRASVRLDGQQSKGWVIESVSYFFRAVWQLLKGRRDRMYQCVINLGIVRGRFKAGRK